MTHEEQMLNLLLDKYERSGHCLPGKASNRRIMLDMAKGDYPGYRENDPCTADINRAVEALESEGLVSASWRRGYENWLYGKVCLNLGNLNNAHRKAGRKPLPRLADSMSNIVNLALSQMQTAWKIMFLSDEAERLKSNYRTSRLLPKDISQVEAIIKVLLYTEHGPELMRVISANCFRDSKYLELNIKSQLVSIAKVYEPELIAYRASGDELLTQNVVLQQLGILTHPEIFEFCGNVRLMFPEEEISAEAFASGFCFQSENLRNLIGLEMPQIRKLMFVENRTNYRHLVMQGAPEDTLLICHGGFYSPVKRKFFSMLSDGLQSYADAFFWGDIDLGGFLMFTRLKKSFFPKLIPWKMDLEDFITYKDCGVIRTETYLDLLRKKLHEEQFDPCFFQVASAILEAGVTVEQEAML